MGVRVLVRGDFACFTRTELSVERVTYDVMSPSAARGILEAIYWKPAIRWVIDKITVLKPIRYTQFRRNEIALKNASSGRPIVASEERMQRSATVLRDVAYVI